MRKILMILCLALICCAAAPRLDASGTIQDGLYLVYGSEGKLAVLEHDRDLKRDGVTFTYHPNAEVKRHYAFRDDRLHGDVRTFDTNGRLISRCTYVDGGLVECR